MKTNQLMRIATVVVLWLILGAGCAKEPPKPQSCNDGTCCMPGTRQYEYVTYLEGVQADLVGDNNVSSGLYFKDPQPIGANYPTKLVTICSLSIGNLRGLQPTAAIGGSSPFKYKVWGKLYWEPGWQTQTATPISDVYVDRIEEVK